MDVNNIIDDYIKYITLERQLSINTIEGYKKDLIDFFKQMVY